MMWSLLRHSPCVMLYRLRKTTNIFDMTIPKADEVFFLSDSPIGPWPPHLRGFLITRNYAPQSVGLLWTSDQLVAETAT